jgi:hypothetical protein
VRTATAADLATRAAGGYDHAVKLWDVRAGGSSSSGCSMSMDHGAPVEDAAFFPSGGLLVTAGGTSLCVWDVLRWGGLMRQPRMARQLCLSAAPSPPPPPPATPRHHSGGKLLRRLSNFQKTVSCVRLSPFAGPDSAAAPRLLAGSLDGHVKVRRARLARAVWVVARHAALQGAAGPDSPARRTRNAAHAQPTRARTAQTCALPLARAATTRATTGV